MTHNASGTGRLNGLRILLAEDSPDSAALMKWILENERAIVTTATNGREAVERVEASPPDAILMDVQMPELDGLAATRQLRSSGYMCPIIALTANGNPEEMAVSIASGCNAHLIKPPNKDLLISTILTWTSWTQFNTAR